MSVELRIRFPWGRYHATPWGRHVNEGAVEWPPSSWRLLRALYSVWQFRAVELDEGVVLGLLAKLAAPPTYDVPAFSTGATRHYLPGKDQLKGVAADTDLAVDAFVVLPPSAELGVRWDVELNDAERNAFAVLAGQLTYLGRAESLCDARVSDVLGEPGSCRPLAVDDVDLDSVVDLLVPDSPLDVAALTASTASVRGVQRRRQPPGAVTVSYPRPQPVGPQSRRPIPSAGRVHAVRWSLAGRALPSRHAAVAVATRLRQRVMQTFGDLGVPDPLSGKGLDGARLDQSHGHAHWFAWGEADGRLVDTVGVWVPMGISATALPLLSRARTLHAAGVEDFTPQRLGLEGWGQADDVLRPLVGPARRWVSYTPFAPTIHRHRNHGSDDAFLRVAVERELAWRGIDAPLAEVDVVRDQAPMAYRRHRPDKERLRHARTAWSLELRFDAPVSGPMALGALGHFGLGLFLPIP